MELHGMTASNVGMRSCGPCAMLVRIGPALERTIIDRSTSGATSGPAASISYSAQRELYETCSTVCPVIVH